MSPQALRDGAHEIWAENPGARDDLLALARQARLPAPGDGDAAGPSPDGPTGRGAARFVRLGGVEVLLKQHRRGGFPARVLSRIPGDGAALFPGNGRLRRLQGVTEAFRRRGGRTPALVAWLTSGRGLRRLYSATERVQPAATLDVPLSTFRGPQRRRLAEVVGRAVAGWHQAGLVHPDLNAGNILVEGEDAGMVAPENIHVIDLEGARVVARVSAAQRAASLARLERSLHKVLTGPPLGDSLRRCFLVAYTREVARLDAGSGRASLALAHLLAALRRRRRLFFLHGVRL